MKEEKEKEKQNPAPTLDLSDPTDIQEKLGLPESVKTSKFYRFWSTGKITLHNGGRSYTIAKALVQKVLIKLPDSEETSFDSLVTSLDGAEGLRNYLVQVLKEQKLQTAKQEFVLMPFPGSCRNCGEKIEEEFFQAKLLVFSGGVCEDCWKEYGYGKEQKYGHKKH